jgi:hypothetical protein
MPSADFPALLKHMALAIYNKGYVSGSPERKLVHSLEISISKLVEWGYLEKRSVAGPPFFLTQKGRRREIAHLLEDPKKSKNFDTLYGLIEEAFEGRPPELLGVTPKQKGQSAKAYAAVSAPFPSGKGKKGPSMRRRKPRVKRARRAKRG